MDYSRSLKAGRRRSTRRVSFVLRHSRRYQFLPKGNVLDIGSRAFYEEMTLDMFIVPVHRERGREWIR